MCIGTWKNGKQCTREIKRDGACHFHYVNPNQTLKATENFKKCSASEHKFSDSLYVPDFVPNKDFMKTPGDETDLSKDCCHCRVVRSAKRRVQKAARKAEKMQEEVVQEEVVPEEVVPEEVVLEEVVPEEVVLEEVVLEEVVLEEVVPEEVVPEEVVPEEVVPEEVVPEEVVPEEVVVPYFPKKEKGKRPPFSELVKCLESLGYVIQTTEEEYSKMKGAVKVQAICPLKHGVVTVCLSDLRKGGSCCRKCGNEKRKKTNIEKTGFVCALQNPAVREKASQQYQAKTGYKHPAQNPEVKEKMRNTYLAKTDGKYYSSGQDPEVRAKGQQTYLAKTGYNFPGQNPEVKEKAKQTYLAKTDGKYSHPFFDPAVREKIKETVRSKSGYDYYFQDPVFREKMRQAYLKKKGYINPGQDPEAREKAKQTNIERSGFAFPGQDPLVQEKSRQTSIENYGVPHAMQNAEYFQNFMDFLYKHKIHTYPSGNETLVQGFEGFCLDDLVLREGIDEDDILNRPGDMPEIFYNFKGVERRYYADIFIPNQNRIIEVKSKFTYENQLEKNIAKARATMAKGFKFEFRIYDDKGRFTIPQF